MIPKTIHYCWFGGKPLPEKYSEYIDSWRKFCPDFEIMQWDESNFDVNQNVYCKEAYESKQWAFVSDYARLSIIYHNGGIYLDTDVELIKSIEPLIKDGIGYIGFQNPMEVTTGLGFAAEANNICIQSMLQIYENRHFILEDGSFNKVPCPAANTVGLMKCGLKIGKKWSKSIQKLPGLKVYPQDYFNPLNSDTLKLKITPNTYTIHQYSASWISDSAKQKQKLKKIIPDIILNERVIRISKRDIKKIISEIDKEKY